MSLTIHDLRLTDTLDQLAAKDREIAALRQERDDSQEGYTRWHKTAVDRYEQIAAREADRFELVKEKAALGNHILALREALKPFADAHFYYSDAGKPDGCSIGVGDTTYGDMRRAVSVLAALEMSGGAKTAPDPAETMRAALIEARIFAVNWGDRRYVDKAVALLNCINAVLKGNGEGT